MRQFILFLLLTAVTFFIAAFVHPALSDAVPNTFVNGAITLGITALGIYTAIAINDMLLPKPDAPANLSMLEVKSILQSKIFWLAVLNLIAVMIKGLFNITIDTATQTEIVNLDWSNILQGVFSLLLIVIRKYDVLSLIK